MLIRGLAWMVRAAIHRMKEIENQTGYEQEYNNLSVAVTFLRTWVNDKIEW